MVSYVGRFVNVNFVEVLYDDSNGPDEINRSRAHGL